MIATSCDEDDHDPDDWNDYNLFCSNIVKRLN